VNAHAAWRLDLAREIGDQIRKINGVRAIVVGGSVARGYADHFSDLEIPIFWEKYPSDQSRNTILKALKADYFLPYNGPSMEDHLVIKGFQVDLWHNTVSYEDMVIEDVVERFDTDLGKSNFMDTIRHCIPLCGEEVIRRWKERAQVYPEQLALKNLKETLDGLVYEQLTLHAKRGNQTVFYGLISELQKRVFLLLLALNREYFPTYKWIYAYLEKVRLKPLETVSRMKAIYNSPADSAIRESQKLVAETLALVKKAFPKLDTDQPLKRVMATRAVFDEPIHLN
jgi:predicted nucleotidyltransferase